MTSPHDTTQTPITRVSYDTTPGLLGEESPKNILLSSGWRRGHSCPLGTGPLLLWVFSAMQSILCSPLVWAEAGRSLQPEHP
jgi:hypothetical protein